MQPSGGTRRGGQDVRCPHCYYSRFVPEVRPNDGTVLRKKNNGVGPKKAKINRWCQSEEGRGFIAP